jgi:hypothetical protein
LALFDLNHRLCSLHMVVYQWPWSTVWPMTSPTSKRVLEKLSPWSFKSKGGLFKLSFCFRNSKVCQ